jgi:hypothetical protein
VDLFCRGNTITQFRLQLWKPKVIIPQKKLLLPVATCDVFLGSKMHIDDYLRKLATSEEVM